MTRKDDDELLDAIDAWHESDSHLELHEWLDMTREEYAAFVEDRPELKSYARPR